MRLGVLIQSLLFCLLLGGCGTDVLALFDEDAQLAWEADEVVSTVEDMNLGLERGFYEAELDKALACRSVYRRAEQRVDMVIQQQEFGFFDQFWADLTMLIALLYPVEFVEDCASAFDRYKLEYLSLREVLVDLRRYPTPAE